MILRMNMISEALDALNDSQTLMVEGENGPTLRRETLPDFSLSSIASCSTNLSEYLFDPEQTQAQSPPSNRLRTTRTVFLRPSRASASPCEVIPDFSSFSVELRTTNVSVEDFIDYFQ
ncbi:hypothetical protein EV356DRAFT_1725 [Viridothelium virens]|uniref:Uncharacterized protein n=1 Tax=Viridothelium virens TaxID=1048519 RepID=A0A6A6HQQ3_VIRVR|nr:hypothetical protein EV356DRAFT_1725 [Viridothelium virens]